MRDAESGAGREERRCSSERARCRVRREQAGGGGGGGAGEREEVRGDAMIGDLPQTPRANTKQTLSTSIIPPQHLTGSHTALSHVVSPPVSHSSGTVSQ